MASIRQTSNGRKPGTGEQIVEKGDIAFFYRPRVGAGEAEGIDDVQQFFMVLKPEGGSRFRVAVLGRKRLPEVGSHERIWGFIDKVAESPNEIEAALGEQRYETKTRGTRVIQAARPAGEGVYALVQFDRSLHVTYELELPERPGEVQEELNVPHEGAYILSIKNPERPAPPGVGLREDEEAKYPRPLQREFRGRRFAAADPRLLDYEGAEFILIGARPDPERAYGLAIDAEHETARKAGLFRQLKMSRGPLEPLVEGEWR